LFVVAWDTGRSTTLLAKIARQNPPFESQNPWQPLTKAQRSPTEQSPISLQNLDPKAFHKLGGREQPIIRVVDHQHWKTRHRGAPRCGQACLNASQNRIPLTRNPGAPRPRSRLHMLQLRACRKMARETNRDEQSDEYYCTR
jgi:hypothetical protein